MASEKQGAPASKKMLWAGRILSTIAVLGMTVSGVMKFVKPPEVLEELVRLGFLERHATVIGILELACIALYAIPRTSVLGAILVTAYLGGAVNAHVRIDDPWFGPVIVGVLVWAGLYLRDERVRALLPLRS